MQFINDPGPWTEGLAHDLSMVDLVLNETIPVAPAALLWWALEHGASLLTAGGPSGAGKSTFTNACLTFLPEGTRAYAVSGRDDPLRVPTDGGTTYLLIAELSRHGRPHYLSGPTARRAFALLRHGIHLVGTLHADSVDEAIAVLGEEVEVAAEDIARAELIAITRVVSGLAGGEGRRWGRVPEDDASVKRRIVEIGLLAPDPERGVRKVELATWNSGAGRLEIAEPDGVAALARWAGVPASAAAAAFAEHANTLARLAAEGRREPREVEAAVRRLRPS
ncbi:MAG: hypothetical protein ACRDIY_19695 [Chloroflexota bacterium]